MFGSSCKMATAMSVVLSEEVVEEAKETSLRERELMEAEALSEAEV